ncbi:MAG: NUDIX domain-containing protein [Candidatus Berkelbacteria bacterium]|nr:MAG: NUDIX domain-containing protein [Candidatus Berkelbacteria bacterium]QQG51790.1 MAG: NUDIX domain-containing protein [Candidatus Berkelbacteria bacterium]
MAANYFSWKDNGQSHLSIGAVVINDEGKICSHHFTKLPFEVFGTRYERDVYLLMRETVEPNETLEVALSRGLMEEFGMKTTLKTYIGSILCHFTQKNTKIEKTTLYFLCQYVSDDLNSRRRGDAEARSTLEWHEPNFLMQKMQQQFKSTGREDINEAPIIARVKKLIAPS